MKIFILSAINSIHTQRWVTALSQNGLKIFLFSIHGVDSNALKNLPNVEIFVYQTNLNAQSQLLKKIKYLFIPKTVKQKIKEFKPDLIHAHYASSYGLIGALTGFHPYIISLWGGDIYKFPKISFLNKAILKFNLQKADKILSTSQIMAVEAKKYTDKNIEITPFGVDINLFKRKSKAVNSDFVIGNVKTLSKNYGIDLLIKTFKILVDNNRTLNLKLQIIGEGPDRLKLEKLSLELGIGNKVSFTGRVNNELLPDYYNNFDVAVSLSHSESFGVVAIEAMSCECPVVVSDADGFTEVVAHNETGFIVRKNNPEAAASAIQKLIDNEKLRLQFVKNGRKNVENLYNWDENVKKMISVYSDVISSKIIGNSKRVKK